MKRTILAAVAALSLGALTATQASAFSPSQSGQHFVPANFESPLEKAKPTAGHGEAYQG